MCNESIESIHVHLLSSVVEEVEPAEMARSIEDRSIYKAVFSVLAQTKLKPETMDEEELRAWLPTDLCQGESCMRRTARAVQRGRLEHAYICFGLANFATSTKALDNVYIAVSFIMRSLT